MELSKFLALVIIIGTIAIFGISLFGLDLDDEL